MGAGARLERAIINFTDRTGGNTGIKKFPPVLINESMTGTGRFTRFAEDMYGTRDDLSCHRQKCLTNLKGRDTQRGPATHI